MIAAWSAAVLWCTQYYPASCPHFPVHTLTTGIPWNVALSTIVRLLMPSFGATMAGI
jgi:hypothetical protein